MLSGKLSRLGPLLGVQAALGMGSCLDLNMTSSLFMKAQQFLVSWPHARWYVQNFIWIPNLRVSSNLSFWLDWWQFNLPLGEEAFKSLSIPGVYSLQRVSAYTSFLVLVVPLLFCYLFWYPLPLLVALVDDNSSSTNMTISLRMRMFVS